MNELLLFKKAYVNATIDYKNQIQIKRYTTWIMIQIKNKIK